MKILFLFLIFKLFFITYSDEQESYIEINNDGSTSITSLNNDELPTQAPTAVAITIKNSRKYMLDYYWVSDSGEGIFQGLLHPRGVTATNAYQGHTFYFTKHNKKKEIYRIYVDGSTNLFIIPPKNISKPHKYYNKLLKELEFVTEYKNRTGQPWLAHYPRDPPIHHMWDADYIGQIHEIKSNQSYWICIPKTKKDKKKCHIKKEITIKLEVISIQPRAFKIMNTLSDSECEIIKQLSIPKLKRSRAGNDGGLESDTRTSSTTWISRKEHVIINTIYKRAADIVNISSKLFHPGKPGNIVEDMQVVHYNIGQEYTPHHDFGADGNIQQRYITLLFYLNERIDNNSGGETAFPKAIFKDENGNIIKIGTKIHPGKGNSIMFYSMLKDGNADDYSLHAALPVTKGEKWLANFWVWDPKR